jgi:hypothetical protein
MDVFEMMILLFDWLFGKASEGDCIPREQD